MTRSPGILCYIRPNVLISAQYEYINFQLCVLWDTRWCVGFDMGSLVVFKINFRNIFGALDIELALSLRNSGEKQARWFPIPCVIQIIIYDNILHYSIDDHRHPTVCSGVNILSHNYKADNINIAIPLCFIQVNIYYHSECWPTYKKADLILIKLAQLDIT